jgi:hypothetical protein
MAAKSRGDSSAATEHRRGRRDPGSAAPKHKGAPKSKKKLPEAPSNEPHVKHLAHVEQFLVAVECAHELFTEVLPILRERDEKRVKELHTLTARLGVVTRRFKPNKRPSRRTLHELYRIGSEMRSIRSAMNRIARNSLMFSRDIVVGLVSRWEEYIGALIDCMLEAYPGRMGEVSRQLSYEEAEGFDRPGSLKSWFRGTVVQQVLSEGSDKLVAYIERQIGVDVAQRIPHWKTLMEVTERRHVLVHNAGTIDRTYLKRCKKLGIDVPADCKPGGSLSVSPKYFEAVREAFFDVGLQLGQLMCRKLYPKHVGSADEALNNIGITFLRDREWSIANRIYSFAMALPAESVSDSQAALIVQVNRCIALKGLGAKGEVKAILDAMDISAAQEKFALAVAVLREDWSTAKTLMIACALSKQIRREEFEEDWPLFWEFREREEFREAFRRVFRAEFKPPTE